MTAAWTVETRRLVIYALAVIVALTLVIAGVLGWRAADALEAGQGEAASGVIGLVGLFTGIATSCAGGLVGVLTLTRSDD